MGHLLVLKYILKHVDELVIVIGSAQYSHRMDDPFTTGERLTMIHNALREANMPVERCWIVPVRDVNVHMLWVAEIVGYTPKFDVVYANEPLTRRLFSEAGFKVNSIPYQKREIYSASEIRKRMLANKNWESLVPESVAKFVNEIDGVQRLRDLNKTDKI
jgi:nicotinamide-nucleotide adenylyltransferase